MGSLGRLLSTIVGLGLTDDLSEDEKTHRRVFTAASLFVCVAGPIWGAMYFAMDEWRSGLIPTLYSLFTAACFVCLGRYGTWRFFRVTQLVLIYLLPFALMLSLGGYGPGSAVMIWAVLAPIGALWSQRPREGIGWAMVFLGGAVVSGLVDPWLRESNNLSGGAITLFFVMNIGCVSGLIFLLLDYYVREKNSLVHQLRRLREIESSFLDQELAMRQNEKLATLGRLSAGMAHELNNPAAAAQQATRQLSAALLSERQRTADLGAIDLDAHERATLDRLVDRIGECVDQPVFLDPLERSDREAEIQDLLEDADVDDAWEIAPPLVGLGITADDLGDLRPSLRPERFAPAVSLLAEQFARQNLLGSLEEGTERIIEIVRALKSYAYLDQAERQPVDLHEGLNSTLVVLQHRLKSGVEVQRAYAPGLPTIEAYGNELNQVWTNIIDNAIDAMDGRGTILIATRRDGDRLLVEFTDDGPGIPDEIADTLFDPFVTSKAPGEGTGLGLNISHNIVTEKHGGEITVTSEPGRTTFTVCLPLVPPTAAVAPLQE